MKGTWPCLAGLNSLEALWRFSADLCEPLDWAIPRNPCMKTHLWFWVSWSSWGSEMVQSSARDCSNRDSEHCWCCAVSWLPKNKAGKHVWNHRKPHFFPPRSPCPDEVGGFVCLCEGTAQERDLRFLKLPLRGFITSFTATEHPWAFSPAEPALLLPADCCCGVQAFLRHWTAVNLQGWETVS